MVVTEAPAVTEAGGARGSDGGEPLANSVDRDAEDIQCVVEHIRHMRSVERLKARAKGVVMVGEPEQAVLGVVGVGGGGTAAIRYAALRPAEPLPFIATIAGWGWDTNDRVLLAADGWRVAWDARKDE